MEITVKYCAGIAFMLSIKLNNVGATPLKQGNTLSSAGNLLPTGDLGRVASLQPFRSWQICYSLPERGSGCPDTIKYLILRQHHDIRNHPTGSASSQSEKIDEQSQKTILTAQVK